jgi:hypothetical protein
VNLLSERAEAEKRLQLIEIGLTVNSLVPKRKFNITVMNDEMSTREITHKALQNIDEMCCNICYPTAHCETTVEIHATAKIQH